MESQSPTLPPLIAIVGCDGSGKSTVSEELLAWINKDYGPAAAAHLGKQQGNTGRSIANLPVIGGLLGAFIDKRATKVRKFRSEKKAPDTFPAIVMYAFTIKRVRRFKRMLALRQKGTIVIADRYPQLSLPIAPDGPDLDVDAAGNAFVRWLAQRELAHFEWMTSFQPDLVIKLIVDVDTAFARKPDHPREALQRKIGYLPQLTFTNAPIVEIDATQPLEQVLAATRAAVAQTLTERAGTDSTNPESESRL
jgi:thymidylate kinase